MSWCYFSEVKKTIRKSLFLYSKTNTNNFDFFSQRVSTWQNDNWKPMEETTCNSQQYLYMIFCIYFAWHDLLYWEMLNPAEWGRESEMSSMAAAVMQVPSSVTLDSYFSPQKYLILSNLTTAATSIPVPLVMGTLFK